jgi:hypothetical protein
LREKEIGICKRNKFEATIIKMVATKIKNAPCMKYKRNHKLMANRMSEVNV